MPLVPRIATSEYNLAIIFPKLAAEWHPTRNGDLTPNQVTSGSGKRVWWLGTCGHEWDASIWSRTNGRGCPFCGNWQVLTGFNDLETRFPVIAAEWHPTKNGDLTPLTPKQVIAGSSKKVWWQGKCGHEWAAAIASRTNNSGYGCPFCAGKRVLVGFNDLGTRFPDIAAEWHPTRNGDLTPKQVTGSSNKKVWWQGACGHEWAANINGRTVLGSGCPECVLWHTSMEEVRLRCELQAAGFPVGETHNVHLPGERRPYHCDIVCPDWKLIIEFDGNWFHRDNHDRDRVKTSALTDAGWTVIRVRDGLEPLFDNDVNVPRGETELVRAKAVVRKAATLGFQASQAHRYLESRYPLGEKEADVAIGREKRKALWKPSWSRKKPGFNQLDLF